MVASVFILIGRFDFLGEDEGAVQLRPQRSVMAIVERQRSQVTGGIHEGMISLPGGTFRMGSDHHYPEEAPAHRVTVGSFWMDRTPVTNYQFRKFVNATGYVTFAEIRPDPKDYPGAQRHMLKAGSLVFTPPKHLVNLRDWSQWWNFKFGANWRRPYGPRSSISGLDDHPVVHIAYRDAEPTRPGRKNSCPPRPNGSLPHAELLKVLSSRGVTSLRLAATIWPTPGKALFRSRISRRMDTNGRRR